MAAMALCQNTAPSFNPSSSSSQLTLIKKTPSSPSLLLPFKPFSSSYRMMMMMTTTSNTICCAAPTSSSSSSSTTNSTTALLPDHHHDDHIPTTTSTLPPPTSSKWSEFAANVTGEWDGHGADFTLQGHPLELPENVVPEAYREWEVKVFDWQTQCPTLALPDNTSATYKLIKLLPTVGCEADAATRHTTDERKIGGGGPDKDNNTTVVSAFAYQSNGSYVAVWPIQDRVTSNPLLELEHCLIDPNDRQSRVRIIQVVRVVDNNCNKLALKSIRVFIEQWYGPFRNGEQLGGCSIRDSAFASTEALNSSQVIGAWEGSTSVANFQNSHNGTLQELLEDSVQKSVRDGENLVLLPKKMWSSVKETEDGETCFEVGWLSSQQGQALTSKCIFSSNAVLKEIVMAQETAVLGQ